MTLRTRVVIAVLAIGVMLVGVLVIVTRTTRDNLVAQVDEQLVDASSSFRRFDEDGRDPRPPEDDGDAVDPRQPLSPLYVGVVSGDEVVTVVQPGLGGEEIALPTVGVDQASDAAAEGRLFTSSSDGSDLRWRIAAEIGPTGAVTVIGLPLDSVDDTMSSLVRLEIVAVAVILAALALVAVWVIRLGVRPVKQMTEVATAIADGDLSHRVPDTDPNTEAGELGEALNKMLGSIEQSFDERQKAEDRLRQFVADASHELRTPVATIRGYAELYRTGALADEESLDDAMRRTEQESIRMGGLVDDLLSLARLDQGRPLELTEVDLAAVVHDAAADARARDPEREVVAVADGPVVVDADESRIRQVVANLVGNALVHTPSTATVTLRAGLSGEEAVVEVADDGPGMAPDVATHAFERFYRADPSRSRHHGGSGLGLSIVDATVRAHGGRVSLDSEPGRGTRVTIVLPVAA